MLEDSDFTNDKKTAHQKAAPPKFFGVSVELGVFGTETDSSGKNFHIALYFFIYDHILKLKKSLRVFRLSKTIEFHRAATFI